MTKKDYQRFATALGMLRRTTAEQTDGQWHGYYRGLRAAEAAVVDVLAADNPRFDRNRFDSWVQEVANHERDATGRRFG